MYNILAMSVGVKHENCTSNELIRTNLSLRRRANSQIVSFRQSEGLTLQTSILLLIRGGNLTLIDSLDIFVTCKFWCFTEKKKKKNVRCLIAPEKIRMLLTRSLRYLTSDSRHETWIGNSSVRLLVRNNRIFSELPRNDIEKSHLCNISSITII